MNWTILIIGPVAKFLDGCTLKERLKVKEIFNLFEEFGLSLPSPYLKRITGTKELWELRTKNIRLLFFVENNQAVVIHGFLKKTKQTPKKELKLAKKRMKAITGG